MPGEDFRLLVDAVADPLLACDADERIRYANPAAQELFGWRLDELAGRPFTDLLPPRVHRVGERSFLTHLVQRVAALQGRPVRAPALRRDGAEVLADFTARRAGVGSEALWVVSLRRLPGSGMQAGAVSPGDGEPFYRLVFAQAPLGLFHFDTVPRITACNDTFARLLGTSEQALVGFDLFTVLDPRIRRCVEAALAGEPCRFEGEYLSVTTGRGVPIRALLAPVRDPQGRVQGGVGMVEDLSEARRAEQARAEQRALVDTLLGSAPLGLAFFDVQLRYVRVNEALARINGTPPGEHLGRTPHEVLGPAGARVERLLRRVLRTGRPLVNLEGTSQRLRLEGPWRAWHASFYPVHTQDGRLLGVGAVVEDITERKRAEEERRRLLREAQQAVQVRDDFLSIASHELKTPLTPLSLRLANLQRRMERGEPVDPAMLHQARQGLLRLAALINDLLDSSRIADGRLALHPQPTRLDALVSRVARSVVSPRDVLHPLDLRLPEGPVLVRGDPDRLEQVVGNLVDNAVKYSPGGGPIEVELGTRGEVALLAVRDHGIGIPEDQQGHLFDRYFRARNASTHKYGGLGLGLYICRDIVERHGGRIWVESRSGEGATFYVALPLLQPAAAQPAPHEEAARTLH